MSLQDSGRRDQRNLYHFGQIFLLYFTASVFTPNGVSRSAAGAKKTIFGDFRRFSTKAASHARVYTPPPVAFHEAVLLTTISTSTRTPVLYGELFSTSNEELLLSGIQSDSVQLGALTVY